MSGNKGSFGRDLDARGQFRASYNTLILFIGTGILSTLIVLSMSALGFRPTSAVWIFPATFFGLSVLFGASGVAIRCKRTLSTLVQISAILSVLAAFLGVFAYLGGTPPTISDWWRIVQAWPEARALMITAFVISALLGWAAHPTLPFRAAIFATILVFMAVWMDFQGYYVVLEEGYDWLIKTTEFSTHRFEGILSDQGEGFVIMLLTTITAWAPIALWVVWKSTGPTISNPS